MNKAVVGWGAAAVIVAAGCGNEAAQPAAAARAVAGAGPASAAASPTGGPVSVTTVAALQRDVPVTLEATGTVSSLNSVDIRPQVASVITRVHIREGQFVKAGQLLFTLDARVDEVNLAKARAQLARDTATLADAQRQLARNRDLLAQKFVSQGSVDTSQTLVETQQAVVTTDRAAVDAALVALSFDRISAPTAGRAGAINVYAGSTVQPGGTALVTITQLDPIAVSFNLPQRDLGAALQTLREGGGKVVAVLPDGRGELVGTLRFVDNVVDASSGTVRAKAQFDNAGQALWPGAFVKVRLVVRTLKGAIVVPQAAVIQAPRGAIVYTVGPDHKALARRVDLLYASGPDAVASGVAAGERVVVDGRQNLRTGSSVVERAPTGNAAVLAP
ncbi:MAG: efflux RND transporter periplasmic adaptor subunit [Burkholderiales bacterium]|nr:efflux RND transporter periplasmic adaptor subunit [Burkholderiales bacterium]